MRNIFAALLFIGSVYCYAMNKEIQPDVATYCRFKSIAELKKTLLEREIKKATDEICQECENPTPYNIVMRHSPVFRYLTCMTTAIEQGIKPEEALIENTPLIRLIVQRNDCAELLQAMLARGVPMAILNKEFTKVNGYQKDWGGRIKAETEESNLLTEAVLGQSDINTKLLLEFGAEKKILKAIWYGRTGNPALQILDQFNVDYKASPLPSF